MSRKEDYVLVPREPTEAMRHAFAMKYYEAERGHEMWDAFTHAYSAMLSAAPASPQPQGVVGERKPLIGRLVFYRTCLMDEHDNSGAMLVDEAITRIQQLENAAHPQPSGDGLSDETLREMYCEIIEKLYPPHPQIPPGQTATQDCAIALARAVEARVRSQPVQQGDGQ